MNASKSIAVISFFLAASALRPEQNGLEHGVRAANRGHRFSERAGLPEADAARKIAKWPQAGSAGHVLVKIRQYHLPFVRRGGILLQRGNAICVVFPPPSLGVSSLDLGRLQPRAAFFLVISAIFFELSKIQMIDLRMG
jgi:hypothetical protein